MSKIKNLADAGYITKTGLVDTAAEEWSITTMFNNGTITKTGLNPEELTKTANGPVATPTFSYDDVKNELSVSCTTDGAEISVMVDNDPWAPYESAIDVTSVYTVIAKATKDGWKDSEPALWEKLI